MTNSPTEASVSAAKPRKEWTEREILAEAYSDAARSWTAPVQGYGAGIPWPLHLKAYDAYCAKWRNQTALIDLPGRGCRGGFSTGELDDFVPGWRDEISEIAKLRAELAAFKTAHPPSPEMEGIVEALREALTVARNRLQMTAVYLTAAGMSEQYEVSEWAEQASAALSTIPASPVGEGE